jgi:A/G-specific adenine glycosylase
MNFSAELTTWYLSNKRDLPWRNTTDPYLIWLSEIILQQTRVDQGMSYYQRFAETYPTICDLAVAPEDDVLRLWQGLGYYSRARNLHATAKKIRDSYNSVFPSQYEDILSLKGIGEYTAAAIGSFAFNMRKPVVDGNVMRVISRYFGVTDPIDSKEGLLKIKAIAEELIANAEPGTHNQAMMEFGAICCTPKNVQCGNCPLRTGCFAYAHGQVDQLPLKKGKTRVMDVYMYYALVNTPNGYLMKKRTGEGIWKGLYDFPLVESPHTLSRKAILESLQSSGLAISDRDIHQISLPIKHLLSHRRLFVCFYHINAHRYQKKWPNGYVLLSPTEIASKGLPRVIEKYLKDINVYE